MDYHINGRTVHSEVPVGDYGPNAPKRRYGEASVAQNASVGLNMHWFPATKRSPAHWGLARPLKNGGVDEGDVQVDVRIYRQGN